MISADHIRRSDNSKINEPVVDPSITEAEDVGRGPILSHDNFSKGFTAAIIPGGAPGLTVVGYTSDTAHFASPTGQYLTHIVASNI